MLKQSILLVVIYAVLFVPAPNKAGAAAFSDGKCNSVFKLKLDANSTTMKTSEQTSDETCFEIRLPPKTSLLTIALEPIQGSFDLYYKGLYFGSSSKLNFAYTIDRPEVYAFPSPSYIAYLIAVVPVRLDEGSSKFSVKFATETASVLTYCPDSGPCSKEDPQSSAKVVNIDLQAGEQVILPSVNGLPDWNCLRDITATAEWSGSVQNLALILKGPDPAAPYARDEGSSPLEIRYPVTSADAQSGRHWELRLVNLSGSTVTAKVEIDLDRGSCLPVTSWEEYQCQDKSEITLRPGDRGTVLRSGIKLRDRTGKVIQLLQAKEHIRVLSGPRCINGVTRWEVRAESGNTGWIPEVILIKDKVFRLLKKVK